MNARDTPQPSPAQKCPHDATWLDRAARTLWPERHAAGLAALAGCPKSTARAWLSGRNRPPISVLRAVIHALHLRAEVCLSIKPFMESEVTAREREPRRLAGWAEIKEWDGPGTIPRDGRWRGGRRR